ncbi:MAG: hypothetical protein WBC73_19535 [Phormidesmis sp.]
MPTPCSRPLKSNPFETYRDPATGQWKVKYPTHPRTVVTPASIPSSTIPTEDDSRPAIAPKRRRWEAPAHTKVA